MKTKQLYSIIIATSMLSCISTSSLFAENSNQKDKIQQEFFQEPAGFGHGELKPYAKMPKDGDVLDSKDYEQVVRQFNWWINKILKPEHIPNKSYVEKNIKLLPANGELQKEDLAFLSYKIKGISYMIVQTGGANAHIRIFVNDPDVESLKDKKEGLARSQNFLRKFINKKTWHHMPPFTVGKSQNGYTAKTESPRGQNKTIPACCFMSESETCLSILKISFEDTLAAREPMPNQWFSWWEKK